VIRGNPERDAPGREVANDPPLFRIDRASKRSDPLRKKASAPTMMMSSAVMANAETEALLTR
jgi:hypothetical protein